MFVLALYRKSLQVQEEYYYHYLENFMYHLSLFEKDDSELYESIEIVFVNM